MDTRICGTKDSYIILIACRYVSTSLMYQGFNKFMGTKIILAGEV